MRARSGSTKVWARSAKGRTPGPAGVSRLTTVSQALGGADRSVLSVGSRKSVLSAGSLVSVTSAGSILSVGSAGSILSFGSVGSILSIGSVNSILSIGSFGSILSVRSYFSILAKDRSFTIGGRAEKAPRPGDGGRALRVVNALTLLLHMGRGRR